MATAEIVVARSGTRSLPKKTTATSITRPTPTTRPSLASLGITRNSPKCRWANEWAAVVVRKYSSCAPEDERNERPRRCRLTRANVPSAFRIGPRESEVYSPASGRYFEKVIPITPPMPVRTLLPKKPMKTTVADEVQAYIMDMHTAEGLALASRRRPDSLRRLRPSLPHRRGPARHLQGALQRGRPARVPWGYVAGLQCDPVEKKPFFHVYPGSDALTSACSAAICTALLPELVHVSQALRDQPSAPRHAADVAGAARRRRPARGGPAGRLQLQRAAHHRRVGGRRLPRGQGGRAGVCVRLQRQRHAGGARLPPAVDRRVQGRSQELRRPPLPHARRHAGQRHSTRSAWSTSAASGWRS